MTLTIALFVASASADVAPPIWYREDCTVDRKEWRDTTCEACSSWHGAGEDSADPTCEEQYAGTEFTYVCQSYGASSWTEVWCDGPVREGCGCASAGPAGALSVLALGALAVLRRRSG